MSDRNHSSRSPVSRSRSPSAHSGRNHSPERSRASSQSLRPSYSRSRSRSHSRKNRRKHSRSHSRSHRSDRRKDYYRSHSRSPFSNRRRHLGSRVVQSSSVGGPNFKHIDIGSENPPTGRCLGVFGLSLYTQDKDLKDVFSKYGPIDQVQVVYDHHTGRSRGFAFVYFENSEDAHMAKERCNGLEVDGRRIRVDYSITQRAHTPTPGVYMGKPTSRYRRSPYRRISNRYSRSRSRSYSRSPPPRIEERIKKG